MTILFDNSKMEKTLNQEAKLIRAYGPEQARTIGLRLSQIRAADNLSDLMKIPQVHCHALTANLAGRFAVNLRQPYRLLFEPADDPLPKRPDGGLDLASITVVRIVEVKKDYHGSNR